MKLLINVDHVATLRNARGENAPCPVSFAQWCEEAGACGIVCHLREDRRHIKDEDVKALKKWTKGIFNLEMAPTTEMVNIALDIHPTMCTLVPEKRLELTTESGISFNPNYIDHLKMVIDKLQQAGIKVSLFIDPLKENIDHILKLTCQCVELHTGYYANDTNRTKEKTLRNLSITANYAYSNNIQVNLGHGLTLDNIPMLISKIPYAQEISIGHQFIADSLQYGVYHTTQKYIKILKSV